MEVTGGFGSPAQTELRLAANYKVFLKTLWGWMAACDWPEWLRLMAD